MKLKLIQTFYQEDHIQHLIPGAEPFFNEYPSVLLESALMVDFFEKKLIKDCDWFGLVSWKYERKISGKNLRGILHHRENLLNVNQQFEQILKSNEIIAPSPNNYQQEHFSRTVQLPHELLKLHGQVEAPLLLILKRMKEEGIINHIPEKIFEKNFYIYSNYWLARRKTYIDYVKNFLIPAIQVTQQDKEINRMCSESACYPNFLPEKFIKQTGFNYYPIAPFVFERLINVYIHYKDIKTAHIL